MNDPINARDFGRIEQRVETLTTEVERLSKSVDELTEVLQQTKGGWKLILIVGGFASALSAFVSWAITHANFK